MTSANDEREAMMFDGLRVSAETRKLIIAGFIAHNAGEEPKSPYEPSYENLWWLKGWGASANFKAISASLPSPSPAAGETEGMADLLTKAIGDITAALTLAGRVSLVARWTAPYIEALNEFDEEAPQPPEQCANIAQKSEQAPATGGDAGVAELVAMLSAATPNELGGGTFDHCPEEIGTHVMEHYRAILAALANHSPDAGGVGEAWKPIESAPRDGTEVILFGPYPENEQGLPTARVTAGFWIVPEDPVIGDCGGPCRCPEYGDPAEPQWVTMHGGSDGGWMSSDGGFTAEWPPTHWKPLPPPPARPDPRGEG